MGKKEAFISELKRERGAHAFQFGTALGRWELLVKQAITLVSDHVFYVGAGLLQNNHDKVFQRIFNDQQLSPSESATYLHRRVTINSVQAGIQPKQVDQMTSMLSMDVRVEILATLKNEFHYDPEKEKKNNALQPRPPVLQGPGVTLPITPLPPNYPVHPSVQPQQQGRPSQPTTQGPPSSGGLSKYRPPKRKP